MEQPRNALIAVIGARKQCARVAAVPSARMALYGCVLVGALARGDPLDGGVGSDRSE
jgi:hypothetical protein